MTKQRKIMILGASILQLPAILKAKDMGLLVIAVDMDKNAAGFKHSDVCEVISTNDVSNVIEIAKKHHIDGVMTLASDMPMQTVAAVSEELGLVGVTKETALKATNKAFMREALKQQNVPIPLFFRVSSKAEFLSILKEFNGRCIVKPVDNSGSRGVFLIDDIRDKSIVEAAFEYSMQYSRSGEIIVEEYMCGAEVSVETLSVDGKVHVISITDKVTTGAPYFVEMGHSQPTNHIGKIKEEIAEVALLAVKAIGIEEGPAHVEIIVTEEGPKIVELGARLGGDNITTHLIPLSTGVDMVECSIKIALGDKPDMQQKFYKGAAIRYLDTQVGIINSIEGIEEAKKFEGIQYVHFTKGIGDEISAINSSIDRVGFVIAQSSTAHEAFKVCEKALQIINVKTVI
ncbi:ATP-grasp domain-containing protein [Paenibacillus sp. GCM10012306]|uniref:ATP-grasp domain-containing protein n=1 Tax=Paenibacillus sp. GCM10012306 TaxID=3317342 RepID=UPI003608404D